MKYRQKNSPVCEAVVWPTSTDHPAVGPYPGLDGYCTKCKNFLRYHGYISNEGRTDYTVCPGDYILFTDFYYPMSKEDFERNYVTVASGDPKADLVESQGDVAQVLDCLKARIAFSGGPKEQTGAVVYHLRLAGFWLRDAVETLTKP